LNLVKSNSKEIIRSLGMEAKNFFNESASLIWLSGIGGTITFSTVIGLRMSTYSHIDKKDQVTRRINPVIRILMVLVLVTDKVIVHTTERVLNKL
jgi:hypothetical protein